MSSLGRVKFIRMFFFYDLVHGTKPVPCFPIWIRLADYSDLIGKVGHPSEAEVKTNSVFRAALFFFLLSCPTCFRNCVSFGF